MGLRFLNILILLCGLVALGFSQEPLFINYTSDDGLPSSEVYYSFQDSKGYMWFCTDNGVSRYDGYNFENYDESRGLTNNTVFTAKEDSIGKIWFATYRGGLCYFENDTILPFENNDSLIHALKRGAINEINFDTLGNMWLSVELERLIIKISKDGLIEEIPVPFIDELHKQKWVRIIPLGNGEYAQMHHDFCRIETIKKRIQDCDTTAYIYGPKVFKSGIQLCFRSDFGRKSTNRRIHTIRRKNGDQLVSIGNAVIWFDDTNHHTTKFPDKGILSILEDKDQGLWLGTNNNGVYHVKPQQKLLSYQNYLRGFSITSTSQDKEGGLWFTSLESGVFYCRSIAITNYSIKENLKGSRFVHFAQLDESTIAINNNYSEILLIDTNGVLLKTFTDPESKVKSAPRFYGMHRLTDENKILVASNFPSLLLDHTSLKEIRFKNLPQWGTTRIQKGMEIRAGRSFANASDGGIWVGTMHLFNKIRNDSLVFSSIDHDFPLFRAITMAEDKNGLLWLGGPNGLFKYDGDTLIKDEHFTKGLKTAIHKILRDSKNRILIGSNDGLFIVDEDNPIQHITANEGLSSNIVNHVIEDQNGVLWASTPKGLNKIVSTKPSNIQIFQITTNDGLVSNEINECLLIENTIWAISNKGISKFNRNFDGYNSSSPPAYIRKININGNQFRFGKSGHINLEHNQNLIDIGFIGLGFKTDEGLLYMYRMIGQDTVWRTTQYTELQFPKMQPGEYEFQVIAINEDGVESSAPATLAFTINPPWWKTWWFRAFIVVGLALTVWIFIEYRTRQVRAKSKLLHANLEYEQKALRSQMNPHFIFNALNSVKKQLREDSGKAEDILVRFAKLMRLILNNSMQEFVLLEDELAALDNYLSIEKIRHKDSFDYKIDIDSEIDPEELMIPPMLIQPFVENAIVHGMSEKESGGLIMINFTEQGELIICTIEDNGIGMTASKQRKGSKGEHKSVGMSVTKKRIVSLLNGVSIDNPVKVEELIDNAGSPSGTMVTIVLPSKLYM